jgi:uncharacterized protein (DUF302 family)
VVQDLPSSRPVATMADESATSTYIVTEPFERAVQLVRGVLTCAKLKITGELDMSGRIKRALLIQTAPCLVIFACPATPAGNFPADVYQAALTPFHIVISSRGSQTDVHVLRVVPRGRDGRPDSGAAEVFGRLQIAMMQAIETIGMRAGLGA